MLLKDWRLLRMGIILFKHSFKENPKRNDKDKDSNLWKKPIDGANDGGSGVGVLLDLLLWRHLVFRGRVVRLSPPFPMVP